MPRGALSRVLWNFQKLHFMFWENAGKKKQHKYLTMHRCTFDVIGAAVQWLVIIRAASCTEGFRLAWNTKAVKENWVITTCVLFL